MKYESSSESESEIELQDSEIWSTQMDDQNLSVVLEYVVSDFFKEIADMGSQEIEPSQSQPALRFECWQAISNV